MASTRKRGETYTGLYRDAAGKQKSAGSFKTEKAAQKAAERAEALVKAGVDPASVVDERVYVLEKRGKITVAAYAPKWLAGHRLEPTSRETYGSALKHVIKHLGDLAVAEVEPHHIRTMLRALERTHGDASVRYARTVAGEMFKTAMVDKICDDNPVAGIKVTSRGGRRMMIATPAQARAIENAIHERYRLLVRTMFATGCRWGETIAIRGTDVEPRGTGYVLRIRRTVSEAEGRIYVKDYGKTRHATRDITIPEGLAVKLLEHGDEWCFRSPRGSHLRRADFRQRAWMPACKAAGVPGLRVHDCRHSHISWLANDPRVPLAAVRDRAGHSSLAVTSRYVHVMPGGDDPILIALKEAA